MEVYAMSIQEQEIKNFLEKITPHDGYGGFHNRHYLFREVKWEENLETTLQNHFYDNETQTTDFVKITPVEKFERFKGKNLTRKSCAIELLNSWFTIEKHSETLIEKICTLIGTEEIEIYFVDIKYGNFITEANFLFKFNQILYSLEFGAND
jgi:hypothetical protein